MSPPLDPAALQVLISRLTGIAEEMGVVLQRSAFSPNIKERADCSAALFTADGQLLVQAEHIPVHLGSMPASVAAVIDAFGSTVQAGEQYLVNDPFAGGTHLNDITVVAPCIVDGRLLGWAANRAHHADVGGAAPGRSPPTPPRSSRRACGSRRYGSPTTCGRSSSPTPAHPVSARATSMRRSVPMRSEFVASPSFPMLRSTR